MYKLRVIKLLYKVYSDDALHALSYLVNKSCAAYDLRRSNRITVTRFNSHFLQNSITRIARTTPVANLRLFIVKSRRTGISRT